MKLILSTFFILAGIPTLPKAQGYCDLIGTFIYAQDKGRGEMGTYLGLISDNQYARESIVNPYGIYGSEYNSSSILNEYGKFGGEYSSYSPFNKYTSTPPVLWEFNNLTGAYSAVAFLSTNEFLSGTTANPHVLLATLKSGNCVGGWTPPVSVKPDLVIDSVRAFISDGEDSIIVEYIVANMGGLTSPAFSVSIEIDGIQIKPQMFSSLNSKMYFSGAFSQKIIHDTTSVIIWADYERGVVEDADDNNFAYQRYITPIRRPVKIEKRVNRPVRENTNVGVVDILGRQGRAPIGIFKNLPLKN